MHAAILYINEKLYFGVTATYDDSSTLIGELNEILEPFEQKGRK